MLPKFSTHFSIIFIIFFQAFVLIKEAITFFVFFLNIPHHTVIATIIVHKIIVSLFSIHSKGLR
jgi:hypothetical protein